MKWVAIAFSNRQADGYKKKKKKKTHIYAVYKKPTSGRDVGGGFRMGNTCTPMVDSCQCMAKPIQYCKIKKKTITSSLRIIKALNIYEKKK